MRCPECGAELPEDSRFCSHCGAKQLQVDQEPHSPSVIEPIADTMEPSHVITRSERPLPPKKQPLLWILPLLLAVCIAGILIWQVGYERTLNDEVSSIQRSGADAALGGNYEIAEAKLNQALAKRPDQPGVRADLATIQKIRSLDDKLTEVQRMIAKSEMAAANGKLNEVQNELSALEGGAYNRLRTRFEQLREKLDLASIRTQAESTNQVEKLGGLLHTASRYQAEDKQEIVNLISDRIVQVGVSTAEQAIESGSYHEAAAAIDEARKYVPEAEKLIELEQQIVALSDKNDSTESQLVFLSGSELNQRQSDLRLSDFKQQAESNGITFSGVFTNASSYDMYELLLEYRAYDAEGSFLSEDWMAISPDLIKAGDTTTFSRKVNAAKPGTIVVIDSVSWYRK
ncbi:zinc ribbon domain-containing protein [Saccharibacillus sp. JS10]|uniref:zinc ribbon domain-containing protein n=1 Tax=Saccharibacillus sp. JS10 TaxID=2950552 RepID=UPI0021099A96|nr:zinc-ribbon domain-containing protein [Saccharibacillus sp. JS10]MCQ4087579.1 zinc-ribbon domain-containing protein [Saccharibacillus sp. JS10]